MPPRSCSSCPSSPLLPRLSQSARPSSQHSANRVLSRSVSASSLPNPKPSLPSPCSTSVRWQRPESPAAHVRASHTSHRLQSAPSASGVARLSRRATAKAKLLQHSDDDVRTSAIKALSDMGPAAVSPHTGMLRQMLRDRNPNVIADAIDALTLVGLRAAPYAGDIAALLKHECATVRVAAVEAFSCLGAAGVPYIDSIVALIHDDKFVVRAFALATLGELSEAAAPHMSAIALCLNDDEPSCRRAAAKTLGRMGKTAKEFMGSISCLLMDDSSVVRIAAIEALCAVGGLAEPNLSKIVAMMMDSAPEVRWAALRVLGGAAQEKLASIAAGLEDKDDARREFAIEILSDFQHLATDHVMQVLQSGSIVARAAAVKTLCKTGEVRLLLSSTDSEVRRMTAETLAKMDHVSQFSLALSKLLGDDKLVRDAAIEALVHIGSEACPYVAAHLGSEHPIVREGALCALGKFGHIALAHVSSVAEMLWDSHHNVREAAVLALQNMGEAGTRHLSASTAPMCLDTACAKHLELPLLEMVCVRIGWSFASNEGRAIAWVHGKENMLESLSGLKGGDLISHIPAMGTLLWKVPLAQALRTAGMKFWPRTWCVPEAAPQTLWSSSFSVEHLGQSVESVCTEAFSAGPAIVIVKPSAGSQGKGISLAGSSQELHSAMEMLAKPDAIIQEYIDRPLLLDGYKWDARIYALVLPRLHAQPLLDREGYGSQSNHFGTEAFACFIAHEGLVRVCLDRYEPASSRNLHRSTSHLTNYSLSKLSEKYIHNEDPNDASHGTKRVLTAVLQRLEDDTETGLSVDDIWQKFGTLVRQTIDAITEPLQALAFDPNFWDGNEEAAKLVRKNFSRCFQVLGFDVLLDTSGDAWLLEVNSAPSLDIYEVVPRNDMPHSIAEVNKVFCAARKGDEPRCRKSGRLCRCAALPHPHTHQQSPIDVAVKVPVVEGALKIATCARDEPFGTPEAWTHGTIYKYITTITDEAES